MDLAIPHARCAFFDGVIPVVVKTHLELVLVQRLAVAIANQRNLAVVMEVIPGNRNPVRLLGDVQQSVMVLHRAAKYQGF